MRQAVIVDAVRTPIGKASSDSGYFRSVRADDLSAQCMKGLVERSKIDPHLVEDVRWGCVMQQGEQGIDIARIALLIAGLPIETGGAHDQSQLCVRAHGTERLRDEHRCRL